MQARKLVLVSPQINRASVIDREDHLAWTLLTAATVSDTGVRDALIERVWNRVSSNVTLGAFPDGYNSTSGALLSGGSGNAG